MHKRFLFISLLSIFILAFKPIDQKNKDKIIEYLGIENYEFIKANNPDLINYYNIYLDKSWYLIDIPAEKSGSVGYSELSVPLKGSKIDKEQLNVLELNIKRKYDSEVRYKIKGSSQILVFLSEKEFMQIYNDEKK